MFISRKNLCAVAIAALRRGMRPYRRTRAEPSAETFATRHGCCTPPIRLPRSPTFNCSLLVNCMARVSHQAIAAMLKR